MGLHKSLRWILRLRAKEALQSKRRVRMNWRAARFILVLNFSLAA